MLPENGAILFSDHALMIVPMQHVPGTLTLTRSSLSFLVDPEYLMSMKEKMAALDARIANGDFKGENKWRALGLPESEEYRLFEVDLRHFSHV